MKWAIVVLFVLVFGLAALSIYMDKELYVRIEGRPAYADSIMLAADDAHAARTIMAQWIVKRPWRDEMQEHAYATNQNLLYCRFLHAKVESLAGR